MNKKEQLMFAHRCSALIESGISLGEALSIILNMETSKRRKKILAIIYENVEKGVSLSKSIIFAKGKFDANLMALIRNGENSGTLALSLRQAYETMEKNGELKKKIYGALMYPAFIGLATVAMTLFLILYIFPKIIPLFSSMNITLPLLTRIVRAIYNCSIQYGLWISVSLIVLIVLFQVLYKWNLLFRNLFQKFLLFLPLIGECIKKYTLSASCRSASVLLENGQSLASILEQNSISSSNESYKKAWNFCHIQVTKGISLSESMKKESKLFPLLVSNMLFIGERTGSLSTMLGHCARIYEQEIDSFIKQLSSLIEPVLMIGMGLIVGSVALSIILPIYEITNHLSQ